MSEKELADKIVALEERVKMLELLVASLRGQQIIIVQPQAPNEPPKLPGELYRITCTSGGG